MSNQIGSKSIISTLVTIYALADIVWASIVATFVGSLLSGGFNLASCGVPDIGATDSVGGVVTGSILAFIVSLFQGGIFLFVLTAAGFIGTLFLGLLKIDLAAVWKVARWLLAAVAIYAFLVATFFKSLLGFGFGLLSGYAGCTASISLGFFGSVAAWVLGFVATFLQGAIFAFVGCAFLFFVALVLVALFGKKRSGNFE